MNADQMKEFVELCKHPAIAGKMGMAIQGDDILCSDGIIRTYKTIDVFGTIATNSYEVDQRISGKIVVIPPIYDYQRPERGLWGMVDKTSRVDILWQSNNTVKVEIFNPWNQFCYSITGPLPLALAKAIIWQHERRPR